jgi:hypothetical protein
VVAHGGELVGFEHAPVTIDVEVIADPGPVHVRDVKLGDLLCGHCRRHGAVADGEILDALQVALRVALGGVARQLIDDVRPQGPGDLDHGLRIWRRRR